MLKAPVYQGSARLRHEFRLKRPEVEAAECCAPQAGADKDGSKRIRVLLCDDDTNIRRALAGMLATEGDMEVVGEAANGLEALGLSRTLHPDAVVMDLSMPVMGGIEATRRIVGEFPGIWVIGLSMFDDPYHAAEMREAGARAFLSKTGPPEDLVAAIRNRAAPACQG
jgi:DNA-binding NarL/FixJ family response regulator